MTRRDEQALHRSFIEHLRWRAPPNCWWCRIPNGGARTAIEGAIFKSLGVRAGAPDLLIVSAGRPLFVEFKAPGRRLSPVQIECHAALEGAGGIAPPFTISMMRWRSLVGWRCCDDHPPAVAQ